MSNIIQWIFVAAAIAGAVAYLFWRLTRPKGACCSRCASCPLDPGARDECSGWQMVDRVESMGDQAESA